jgi:hypothetical protein
VYLPRGVTPLVKVGDASVGGETVFAELAPVRTDAPSREPEAQAASV